MPSFFLDEKEISFEPGEDILSAALREGEFIPHFCYHPALSRAATCRMCLVEIIDAGNGRGMPKLQTACSTPAADGMKVASSSEKVKRAREAVMEFLLINHPLDCPICDQAGECSLQDFSFDYGTGKSIIADELSKRVYGYRNIGTFLAIERNRCIQCTRCVRFSREISKTHEMGVYHRSNQLTVDTFIDKPLSDPFQGNLADICPVGALTSRDFRFKKRVWFLQKTSSICAGCSTGCNIEIHHAHGKVERFIPRENQDVNQWWMCDYGRISFRALVSPEKRQLACAIKGKPAMAETALEKVAKEIKDIKEEKGISVIIGSNQSTVEESYALKTFCENYLPNPHFFAPIIPRDSSDNQTFLESLLSNDQGPNSKGLELVGYEVKNSENKIREIDWSKVSCLVVVGEPWNKKWLKKAMEDTPLTILFTTNKTELSEYSDITFATQSHLEKNGSYVNKQGRIQRNNAAMKGFPESQNEIFWLSAIEKKLEDKNLLRKNSKELLMELSKKNNAFAKLKESQLTDMGLLL